MTLRPSRFTPEAQLLPPPDGKDLLPIMNTSGPPGAETKPESWREPLALGGMISPPRENHEISHRMFFYSARSLEPPGDWSDHDVFFRDKRTREQSPPPIREGASEPPSRGSPAELYPQRFLCAARSLEPPGDWSDHDLFFRDKRTREQSPPPTREGASEPPSRGLTMKMLTRKNLHPERSLEPPGLKRNLMTGGSPPEVRSNLPEILQTSSISQPLESFYT